MNLKSSEKTLREVLSSNFFFIPRFQRPYSWTKENVEEFWEDAIQESTDEYFIGSMVVYQHGADSVAVIDGQQRLATLMMLLCAIRDEAQKLGAESLANGTHTFVERTDENDNSRFILKTETSYPFLQDQVLSRGEAELDAQIGREEKDILAAYKVISTYVSQVVATALDDLTLTEAKRKKAAIDRLKGIRDRILNLRLIFIAVGDQDEATTIFVTLNSRGKDLEPADLVKAHLLNLMPSSGGLDRPLERWQAIVDKFDESQADINMSTFLHTVWRSRYGSVTEKNLVRAIRKKIKKAQAKGFLKELESDAELYRQILEPDYRNWRKTERDAQESLYFFGNFKISQPMPLLLSVMRAFQAKEITIKQLKRVLKAMEDYHFSYNVLASKTSTGGMSLYYARRARSLLGADDKAARSEEINDVVDQLKEKRPTDAEYDEAFSDLWLTNDVTADKRVVRYVLRRFHQHHKPQAAVDFRKMTVEHLSSQSKPPENVGRVGNLIFVDSTLNDQLANKSFKAKVEILRKVTHQWVPQDVLDAKSWGKVKIAQRTSAMASEARTAIWSG